MNIYDKAEAYLDSFLINHEEFSNIRVSFNDYFYWAELDYFHADLQNRLISLIGFPTWVDMKFDKLFYDNAVNLGLKEKCSIFIFSFFHELGHFMTKDIWQLGDNSKAQYVYKRKGASSEDKVKEHMMFPEEIRATKWAVRYINNHADEVRELENNIKDVIDNYEDCKQFVV